MKKIDTLPLIKNNLDVLAGGPRVLLPFESRLLYANNRFADIFDNGRGSYVKRLLNGERSFSSLHPGEIAGILYYNYLATDEKKSRTEADNITGAMADGMGYISLKFSSDYEIVLGLERVNKTPVFEGGDHYKFYTTRKDV
jgi:hypothetical protein